MVKFGVRRSLPRPARHDQLLFEEEVLSDHGSHAARPAESYDRDDQVQQGEKDGFHTRHSRSRGRRHATLPTPRIQREN